MPEYPSPSARLQSLGGPAAGQELARPFESDVKSRFAPPHCIQLDPFGWSDGLLVGASFSGTLFWAFPALPKPKASSMRMNAQVINRCMKCSPASAEGLPYGVHWRSAATTSLLPRSRLSPCTLSSLCLLRLIKSESGVALGLPLEITQSAVTP